MTSVPTPSRDFEAPDPTKVFVVYGRNHAARKAMFEFLRSIGLQPMEWSELLAATGAAAPYIGQVLERGFTLAQAVIILFTPDDEGQLRKAMRKEDEPPWEDALTPQARLNVIFEAGMAFATHPNQTVMVELGQLRPFSDIAGRQVIRLDNRSQRRQELAHRLELAGCRVNLRGTDWHTAGDFEAAIVPTPPADDLQASIILEPAAHRLQAAVEGSRDHGPIEIVTRSDEYNAKVALLEQRASRVDKTIHRLNTVFKPEELAVTVAEQRYGPQSEMGASYIAAHASRRAAFFEKLRSGALHHREICSKSLLETWISNPKHTGVDVIPRPLIYQQIRSVIDTLHRFPRNYSLALSDALHPFLYAVFDNDVVVVHEAIGRMDIHRVNAIFIRQSDAVSAFSSEFELLWQSIPVSERDNTAVAAWLEETVARTSREEGSLHGTMGPAQ